MTPENSSRLAPHGSWHSIPNASSAVKANSCRIDNEATVSTNKCVALRHSPAHKENAVAGCFKKTAQFRPKVIGRRQSDSNDQKRLNSVGSHETRLRLKKPQGADGGGIGRFGKLATSASLSQKKSKGKLSATFTPGRLWEPRGSENRPFRESFAATEIRDQSSSSALDPSLKDFTKLNWFLRRSSKRMDDR